MDPKYTQFMKSKETKWIMTIKTNCSYDLNDKISDDIKSTSNENSGSEFSIPKTSAWQNTGN